MPVSESVSAASRCSRSARSLVSAMKTKAMATENSVPVKQRMANHGEATATEAGIGTVKASGTRSQYRAA